MHTCELEKVRTLIYLIANKSSSRSEVVEIDQDSFGNSAVMDKNLVVIVIVVHYCCRCLWK